MAATMMTLRRAVNSALFGRIGASNLTRSTPALTFTRSFNTKGEDATSSSSSSSDDEEDRRIDVQHRSDRPAVSRSRRGVRAPTLLPDAFDPFSPTRSLSQVLNLMDQLMEDPFSRGYVAGSRRGWDVREENDALYLRIDMPGLGKEDVKISVDQDTLIIRAEGDKESDEEESRRRYSSRIDLPQNVYNINEIKAEMKNGVLKVFVPKVRDGERKDVFHVEIQ